jgi:isoquinoline 1-oxidoreductase beta subunit
MLFGIDQVLRDALRRLSEMSGDRRTSRQHNLDEIKKLGVVDAFVLEGNGNVGELMPGVAIVATNTWTAFKAKQQLKIMGQVGAADNWPTTVARAAEA